MSPRERVLAALAHQESDRVPRDFWAEEPSWNRLLEFLRTSDREAVLRQFGIDIRHLNASEPPHREVGDGIYQNFWGERYTFQPTPWGPLRHDVKGALARARDWADFEAFPWPEPDCMDYRGLATEAAVHGDYALIYGFADVWQRPALVRGWEEMFLDMIDRPDVAHFLCRKFTDFYREDYTRAAEVTGGRIDLFLLISDLGCQRGPLISIEMFRRFVAPYLKEMIDLIHTLGARVLFHSCGAIRPFIEDLIRMGVDVLDPIQPTGPDMAPERLEADFGRRLCFHGGIDMQLLLPSGTSEEVRREGQRYCRALGRRGGYVLAPAHLFQPDVPPENIIALYEEAP